MPANLEKPYVYSLMWYKKEGGSVIKALDADLIASIAVLQTSRPLAVLREDGSLTLQSDANSQQKDAGHPHPPNKTYLLR